jgi:hypothetical protein
LAGRSLDDSFTNDESQGGFPLSSYIQQNYPEFYLGRVARYLAMEGANNSHFADPEKVFKKFSYRSALQVYLHEYHP